MEDYFTAYRRRREKVNEELEYLAKRLAELGYTVYKPKEPNITFIVVVRGQKQATVSFEEVPYRWTINISIKPNRDTGSGYNQKTKYEGLFTLEEVVESLRDYNGNIEDFHNRCSSYLMKIEPVESVISTL